MTEQRQESAIAALRWTVGVVVLLESAHFTISTLAGHLPKMGLPQWFWIALGAAEAVGALLFLFTRTRVIGGWALLVIFGIAAVIHILNHGFDVGSLVVYGAAVFVCLARQNRTVGGASA